VAAGVDGIFFEVHRYPEKALCDGANSLYLSEMEQLLKTLAKIDSLVKNSQK
jgi:2-dehydro-3-deoxyphosphooctonate aldolase (KDO 8-P synthase)